MAEIIVEPSALSKIIPISFKINDTDSITTTRLATKKQFNTTDTDAWLSFTLDGIDANMTGDFDLTMVNVDENPSSIINRTNLPFSAIPFHYKIDASADVEKNQIRHAGRWIGQVIIRLANGDTTTRQFDFAIVGHLLDGKEARLILIEDYNALMATITTSKDELAQYNIDYAALIETVTTQEAARVQAELTRAQTFDALVESEMIAQNVATKLTEKEATYAPRLFSVEQQLEQTQAQFNQAVGAVTEDSEVVLARNEHPTLKERLDGEWDNVNAQLAEKVKNFKIKNEVVNGDFSQGLTSWMTFAGGGVSVQNGELKVSTLNNQGYVRKTGILTINNKYYLSFKSRLESGTAASNGFFNGNTLVSGVNATNANVRKSAEFIATSSDISVGVYYYANKSDIAYYDDILVIDRTLIFGAGNEPTKLEMDALIKFIPNQWWDGELTLTQKQVVTWQLNLIRKNTNAIISLGGTII